MSSPSPSTATKSGQEGKQSTVIEYIKKEAEGGVHYVLNIKFSSANDDNGSYIRTWFYNFIVNGGSPHCYEDDVRELKIKWETGADRQSSAYYLSKPTFKFKSSVSDDIYCKHTDMLIKSGLELYSLCETE